MSRGLTPVPPARLTNPERMPEVEARMHARLGCRCAGDLAACDEMSQNAAAGAGNAPAAVAR